MMRILLMLVTFLVSAACWANAAQAAQENAFTPRFKSETREADYTIGSIARQHLEVEVPRGYVLDEGSLPEKEQTEAVELRDISWKIEEDKTVTRYQFAIEWQIFVAFETVKSTPLRGLELVFQKDGKSIDISIPPDSVLISNLLPPKMDEKHVRPYPDVPPQPINVLPFWLGGVAAFCLLLISGFYIAWFMGWVSLPSERNMPFRQAWREIKNLPEHHKNSVPNALQILGHAVSQHAGHTVTLENLTTLFAKQHQLQHFSLELTKLYQEIQRTFFAGSTPALQLGELKKIAKKLSQLELS